MKAIVEYAKKHPHFKQICLVAFDEGTRQLYSAELKKLLAHKKPKEKKKK